MDIRPKPWAGLFHPPIDGAGHPMVLNKRDRRTLARLAAGRTIPSTIPEKRIKKLVKLGWLPASFPKEGVNMSSSYSDTVAYTRPGQGPIEDEKMEGRIHYHHTSDTATWQTRKVGEEQWKDKLVMSFEEMDALFAAMKG